MVQRKKSSRRKPPSQRPGRSGEGGGASGREKTFNLFLFVDGDAIIQLGVCCHEQEGADRQKLSFLQSRVEVDLPGAERFPIPDRYKLVDPGGTGTTGLRYQSYLDLSRLGRHLELFEEVFVHFGAPDNPLMCITPVVDGTPRVETITRL